MAQCLEQLGRTEEAREIYQMILDIEIEFFSKIHLRELPYYQALCAEALGQQPRAWDIMARVKRAWSLELDRVDNGFFATTPFFISFAPEPRLARRAYYLYLLGLVSLYEGAATGGRCPLPRELCAELRQSVLPLLRASASLSKDRIHFTEE